MTDDLRGSWRETLSTDSVAWVIGVLALVVMMAVIASNMVASQ